MSEPRSGRAAPPRPPRPGAPDLAWLYHLRPSSPHPPHTTAEQTRRDGRRVLGDGPVEWAVEIARDVAVRVGEKEPSHVVGDGGLLLRQGIEATVLRMMAALVPDTPRERLVAPEEAFVGARLWARRGVPVDSVLRAIRVGHSHVSDHLLSAVEKSERIAGHKARSEEMSRVSRILFAFIDDFASAMSGEHKAESERWVGSTPARRLSTVEEILSLGCRDVRQASDVLGYDLRREHIAVVLHGSGVQGTGNGNGRSVDLVQLGSRLTERRASLVVAPDPTTVWLWTTAEPDFAHVPLPPDVRASVGLPLADVDGFRGSHLQACHAGRIATFSGSSVTRYEEVEIAALMTGDVALAHRFVSRELGALADPDAKALRDTVRSYLEAAGSINQAARALYVAKNTVTYRIRKAERLLGRSVHVRSFELLLALRIMTDLGTPLDTLSDRDDPPPPPSH